MLFLLKIKFLFIIIIIIIIIMFSSLLLWNFGFKKKIRTNFLCFLI